MVPDFLSLRDFFEAHYSCLLTLIYFKSLCYSDSYIDAIFHKNVVKFNCLGYLYYYKEVLN